MYSQLILIVSLKIIIIPNSIAQKCEQDDPYLELPSTLQKFGNKGYKHGAEVGEYTINIGTKTLSINCSSTNPVLWKVSLSKAYINSKIEFLSEITDATINGRTTQKVCYTAIFTMLEVNEDLTGLYICENVSPYTLTGSKYLGFYPALYIYGANDSRFKGLLLNRGSNITLSIYNTEPYDMQTKDDLTVILPCNYNYPTNMSVTLSTSWKTGKKMQSVAANKYTCSNYRNFCVDLGLASLTLQREVEITCKGQTTNESQGEVENTVLVYLLPSPGILQSPSEETMRLNVRSLQPLTFSCKSISPITILMEYPYEKQESSFVTSNLLYSYNSQLTIIIPELKQSWQTMDIEVTCVTIANNTSNFTWTYTLVNANGILSIPYGDAEMQDENRILKGFRNGKFVCKSTAPTTFKVFFVPCSTFTICQMRSLLLYSEDYRLTGIKYSKSEVRFGLPTNVSGMARCVGFQKDIMAFSYVGLMATKLNTTQNAIGMLSSTTVSHISNDINPLVLTNATEIFEGESVSINCTTPLFLLVSNHHWEFTFRNKSKAIVMSEYIVTNNSTATQDELFFTSATIKIPSMDVTGIACVSTQFSKVSPIVWINGILKTNGESIETETKRDSVAIKVKALPPGRNNLGNILGITFGVMFLIITVMAIASLKRLHYQNVIIDKIREEEIELFRTGIPEMISELENANTNAQNLPYDKEFEINPEDLIIEFQIVLGSGEFGIVFKGSLVREQTLEVAVKTVKPGASASYLRAAMSELKLMIFVKTHENIVKFIGASTEGLLHHKLLILMEYCQNGNLLSYLRKKSGTFGNQVQAGRLDMNLVEERCQENRGHNLSTTDLLRWACQISKGMKFISNLNVIHGDLAARNILLDENLTAKISDFGLSKKLYQYSKYVRNKSIALPWKWLAVESLMFTEFSLASDIWAFGVTLWEIFTLGAEPYPGQEYNSEFINKLQSGFRNTLPEFATYEMCSKYTMMLKCWKNDPLSRPNFNDLHEQFSLIDEQLENATRRAVSSPPIEVTILEFNQDEYIVFSD